LLDVGDKIVRGDDGGDKGAPLEPLLVKNGKGAIETSSSSVTTDPVGEPRDDTVDSVGLEILAPVAPNENIQIVETGKLIPPLARTNSLRTSFCEQGSSIHSMNNSSIMDETKFWILPWFVMIYANPDSIFSIFPNVLIHFHPDFQDISGDLK
jgi:hypothetical protein